MGRRWKRFKSSLGGVPALLDDRYRQSFVFIHINKTGGSSVERALQIRFEHRTALEKRTQLGGRHFDAKFRFSIVRNPWDRVASHYAYRVRTNQTGLGDDPIPFADWVRRTYGEQDPRYYDKPRMFMPQLDWLTDSKGHMLVDFVGRFERLNEDFALICARLGRRADLPHLKSSGKGDYRRCYDDDTADIVARWFARDIASFEYAFDSQVAPNTGTWPAPPSLDTDSEDRNSMARKSA